MSWMTGYKIIYGICAFLWTIILARYLGAAAYGIISFGIAFTNLTKILLNLGTDKYLTREISRYKEKLPKFINNIIPLKLILSVFLIIFTFLVLILLGYNGTTIIVTLIFSINLIFLIFAETFASIFQAHEDMKYQSIGGIIFGILIFLITIILATINSNNRIIDVISIITS